MSKPHRGRSLRELFAHGRGECPICKRKNIKVLYEQDAGDQKFKICKTCRAAIKNGTKSLPVTAKKAEPQAEVEETKPSKVEAVEAAPAEETQEAVAETA